MIVSSSAPNALSLAIETLKRDELVAIPTETVYGLAGISTSAAAISRIYATKNRPGSNPLISHVSGIEMAERYAIIDPVSERLADAFWPGPLTLILPLREGGIDRSSTNSKELVAIRAPKGFAHDLIAELDQPLAAPSANSSGRISPTTARHVADDLGERVPLIIDGGPTQFGVESTVVRANSTGIAILRPGSLTGEEIAKIAMLPLMAATKNEGALSPGNLLSHYAPRAKMRLNATHIEPGESVITFGDARPSGIHDALAVFNLSKSGDLIEAAHRLFDLMHQADETGAKSIAVTPIPTHGVGLAINDRLNRAAAPRD